MRKFLKDNIVKVLWIIGFLGIISSCEDSYEMLPSLPETQGVNWDEQVEVSIPFQLDKGMTSTIVTRGGTTKVLSSDIDSQISGIMVFVYEAKDLKNPANNKRVAWHLFTNPADGKLPEATSGWEKDPGHSDCGRLVFNLPTGDVYVYLVANAMNSFLTMMPSTNNTMDELATQADFLRNVVPTWTGSLQSTDGFLPMSGKVPNRDARCRVQLDAQGKGRLYYFEDGTNNLIPLQDVHQEGVTTHSIKLERMLSKVQFTIQAKQGATFTPRTYKFYHVSRYAAPSFGIWNEDILDTLPVRDTERHHFTTQSPNSFTVFLPPNGRKPKTTQKILSFHDRDKVVKDALGKNVLEKPEDMKGSGKIADHPDHYLFEFAPVNTTYVEITGQYYEKGGAGQTDINADTKYLIHLGDFSKGDFNNFDVIRNTFYRYTLTIHGVDQIVAEVETQQENQSGAEGIVFQGGRYAEVDAHYEQVEMRFSKSDIKQNKVYIHVATPFAGGQVNGYYNLATRKFDLLPSSEVQDVAVAKRLLQWVQFKKQVPAGSAQSAKGNLAVYTPAGQPGGVVDIFTALDDFYKSSETDVFYTCFVDEYYYTRNPVTNAAIQLRNFVNAPDRIFAIAAGIDYSADGKSAVANSIYVVQQRSIATFYNLEPETTNGGALQVYGVETYSDETDRPLSYGGREQAVQTGVGQGLGNTWQDLTGNRTPASGTSIRWADCVNMAQNGYMLEGTGAQEQYVHHDGLLANNRYGYLACLTRNRDLNGNGILDADELRWYTPSRDELLGIWIGEDAMPRQAALYTGSTAELTAIVQNSQAYKDNPRLLLQNICVFPIYSSSKGNNRQIWAEQGCSYSAESKYVKGNILVVRNLGSNTQQVTGHNSQVNPNPFFHYNNTTQELIVDIDPGAMREFSRRELIPHHERSLTNRVGKKIQVASKPYTELETRTFTCYNHSSFIGPQSENIEGIFLQTSHIKNAMQDLRTIAQNYQEGTSKPTDAVWRLPNQRELALLVVAGLDKLFQSSSNLDELRIGRKHTHGFFNAKWENDYGGHMLFCRTAFSNSMINGSANPYTEYGYIYNWETRQIQMFDGKGLGSYIGGYLCVRDVR